MKRIKLVLRTRCARCGHEMSSTTVHLTPRQMDTLEVLRGNGTVMATQQVADALGVGRQAAYEHLRVLRYLGLVEKIGQRRGWRAVQLQQEKRLQLDVVPHWLALELVLLPAA